MSAVDVDLVVGVGGTHVSSRRWGIDGGLLVGGHVTITFNSLPDDLWVVSVGHLKEPAIVETHGGACVTTENEDLLGGRQHGGVLGPGSWDLIALRRLLFPVAVLYFKNNTNWSDQQLNLKLRLILIKSSNSMN